MSPVEKHKTGKYPLENLPSSASNSSKKEDTILKIDLTLQPMRPWAFMKLHSASNKEMLWSLCTQAPPTEKHTRLAWWTDILRDCSAVPVQNHGNGSPPIIVNSFDLVVRQSRMVSALRPKLLNELFFLADALTPNMTKLISRSPEGRRVQERDANLCQSAHALRNWNLHCHLLFWLWT